MVRFMDTPKEFTMMLKNGKKTGCKDRVSAKE